MTSILCRVLGHRYRYYVIQESTQPQADVYRSCRRRTCPERHPALIGHATTRPAKA